MYDDDKVQVTLEARVLLEAITGIPDEVQALDAVINPDLEVAPSTSPDLLRALTPEESRAWTNTIKQEVAAQVSTVVPREGVCLTTSVGTQPFKETVINEFRTQTISNLDFGWLPLEEYPYFQERQYVIDGTTLSERAEPVILDTATFVSAIIQLRSRIPGYLELLIFSDPVVKASDDTTTIKAVFVVTRNMPRTALNRPQWLVEVLNQKTHKVRRCIKPLQHTDMSLSSRLTREGDWQSIRRESRDPGGEVVILPIEEKVGDPFPTPR